MRTKVSVRARLFTILGICFGLHAFTVGGPAAAAAQEGAAGPFVTRAPAAGTRAEADARDARAPANAALREAEEAAARAEAAAEEARAFAVSLADEAMREADREEETAARAAENAPATRADLEDLVERAEEAADEAWVAARAAERASRDREYAHESGPYIGAAFVYGAEEFDDDLIVKSSLGAAGFVGWRVNSLFAAELRYTVFDGFDIQASNGKAEIDGYAVTLNVKVYPISTRIQPFVLLGVGGMNLESKTKLNDGRRSQGQDSDAVFRLGAGVDLPLSDVLTLNLEVAYLAPADELSDLNVTALSTGLTYQF